MVTRSRKRSANPASCSTPPDSRRRLCAYPVPDSQRPSDGASSPVSRENADSPRPRVRVRAPLRARRPQEQEKYCKISRRARIRSHDVQAPDAMTTSSRGRRGRSPEGQGDPSGLSDEAPFSSGERFAGVTSRSSRTENGAGPMRAACPASPAISRRLGCFGARPRPRRVLGFPYLTCSGFSPRTGTPLIRRRSRRFSWGCCGITWRCEIAELPHHVRLLIIGSAAGSPPTSSPDRECRGADPCHGWVQPHPCPLLRRPAGDRRRGVRRSPPRSASGGLEAARSTGLASPSISSPPIFPIPISSIRTSASTGSAFPALAVPIGARLHHTFGPISQDRSRAGRIRRLLRRDRRIAAPRSDRADETRRYAAPSECRVRCGGGVSALRPRPDAIFRGMGTRWPWLPLTPCVAVMAWDVDPLPQRRFRRQRIRPRPAFSRRPVCRLGLVGWRSPFTPPPPPPPRGRK